MRPGHPAYRSEENGLQPRGPARDSGSQLGRGPTVRRDTSKIVCAIVYAEASADRDLAHEDAPQHPSPRFSHHSTTKESIPVANFSKWNFFSFKSEFHLITSVQRGKSARSPRI